MSPRRRANETSGHDEDKIGTPLKTAVTDSCVDDNTGPYAQSCAYASLLASLCRPSSTPQGSDNFDALPPVPALSRLHWGLIICRPRSWTQIFGSPMASGDNINIITLARGEIMLRMVKLRGGAVKSSRWRAWLNHFAAQSGGKREPGRATRPIAGACSEPAIAGERNLRS